MDRREAKCRRLAVLLNSLTYSILFYSILFVDQNGFESNWPPTTTTTTTTADMLIHRKNRRRRRRMDLRLADDDFDEIASR